MSAKPVPITQAAAQLGKSPATVRRWVQKGAPTAILGGPGRGRGSWVSPDDIERWRASESGKTGSLSVPLADLQRYLDDYLRSGDHRYAGMRDDVAKAYLDALLEYVAGRLS